MDRPWPWWEEETPASFGLYRFYGDYAARNGSESLDAYAPFRRSTLRWPSEPNPPAEEPYTGRILVLVDGRCGSACEDFVMPLSWTDRATLVGETTAGSTGQPWFHDFGDGMKVFVGTKRAYMPDGTPFEGVGLAPDVEVVPSVEDLAAGRDPVLDRAKALAAGG